MTNRQAPNLQELFKQAAEIAKQVPSNMQEAAFNRALDLLVGAAPTQRLQPRSEQKANSETVVMEGVSSVDSLLKSIDSTRYPAVRSARSVLDRALNVLQIALDEYGVDGLTPVDIARILTEKFRVSTSRQAVGMALMNAADLVDRVAEGRGYKYRIMGPGKDHLASNASVEGSVPNAPARNRSRRRSGQRKRAGKQATGNDKTDQAAGPATKAKKRAGTKRRTGGKVGPKAVVESLIEAGFFSSPKTGPDVQQYVKNKRGFDLGTNPLRFAMLRLVREGILERDVNEDGQYEYKRP